MQKGANMNTNSRNVTYSTVGDYLLPNLTLNQPRKPLGKYGRLRRTYLMNHRPVLYNTMLLNGSLYRKSGYSKKFLEAHREEITLHKAAKAAFDEAGLQKLPKV
ncbi:MAG: TnpV protein, partial [Clostridia bacterium]